MKYLDEFRDPLSAEKIIGCITKLRNKEANIMEVCGTHTMAIFRYGIKDRLPKRIRLISGPGCPVCVTPIGYIDAAIRLSRRKNTIITTFGDMIKVPGSISSLKEEKSRGCDIRIVLSPFNAVNLACQNPEKKVIFLAVGFETTAPVIALSILKAAELRLNNFFLLQSLKTMPAVLKLLLADQENKIDGMICPGHVAAIIGEQSFSFLKNSYNIPAVIAGFESNDILLAVYILMNLINRGESKVVNQYKRAVKLKGNDSALKLLKKVFIPSDNYWRGIGMVKRSGLSLKRSYSRFSAEKRYGLKIEYGRENEACICGEILKGKKAPTDCPLFADVCTPAAPSGPCMVSHEGSCAIYFKYNLKR